MEIVICMGVVTTHGVEGPRILEYDKGRDSQALSGKCREHISLVQYREGGWFVCHPREYRQGNTTAGRGLKSECQRSVMNSAREKAGKCCFLKYQSNVEQNLFALSNSCFCFINTYCTFILYFIHDEMFPFVR